MKPIQENWAIRRKEAIARIKEKREKRASELSDSRDEHMNAVHSAVGETLEKLRTMSSDKGIHPDAQRRASDIINHFKKYKPK